MTAGPRLKKLRTDLGLSQEAMGAQGFISTPGWIKIESGHRQPSEKLIARLCEWLIAQKHMGERAVAALQTELLTRKYLGHRSPFLREIATLQAATLPNSQEILAELPKKPRRPRPFRERLSAAVVGATAA